jgi:hypothetical protein
VTTAIPTHRIKRGHSYLLDGETTDGSAGSGPAPPARVPKKR